jgi:bifunctional DNase/RNase
MTNEKAIEMFVGGLMLDPNTQAPVVVLKDEAGEVVLPIWIGVAEATSIASAIKQIAMARPLTHDLMMNVMNEIGGRIERIVITELKDSTYYAELVVSVGERALIFDSRPSDAIAMALRASAPIYVTQQVLEQAKVTFAQVPGAPSGQKKPAEGAEQNPEEGEQGDDTKPSNLATVDKSQWTEILDNLDPDDFKYKM